jgi:hypothetical protein
MEQQSIRAIDTVDALLVVEPVMDSVSKEQHALTRLSIGFW